MVIRYDQHGTTVMHSVHIWIDRPDYQGWSLVDAYTYGVEPPRYPVPAIRREPLCLVCGSMDAYCHLHPQECIENKY